MNTLKKYIKSKEEKHPAETVGLKQNLLDEKRNHYNSYSKNKNSKITKLNFEPFSKENNNDNISSYEFKVINPQLDLK